jgi:hypothetical protein
MLIPDYQSSFLSENSSTFYDFATFLIVERQANCTSKDNDGNTLLSLCVKTIPSEESNTFVQLLLRHPGVIVDDRVLEAAKPYFERSLSPSCEKLVEMLEAKVAEQERGNLSNYQSQDTDTAAKGYIEYVLSTGQHERQNHHSTSVTEDRNDRTM